MLTSTEADLPSLPDDLRTEIVRAGMFSYSGPDPIVRLILAGTELPQTVLVIVTTVEPEDLSTAPPQTIEPALRRMWQRALGVDLTRTTFRDTGRSRAPDLDLPPGGGVVAGRGDEETVSARVARAHSAADSAEGST